MPVAIEQVKKWLEVRGVGHVVTESTALGVCTACDSIHVGCQRSMQDTRPARICRKCRERLETLSLTPPKEPAHA
jgi:hypothetical protein